MQQPVSAGMAHTLACTGSGRVYGFGASRYGQVGDGGEANTPLPVELWHGHPNGSPDIAQERIVSVDCGYEHSAALSSRGVLYTWGRDVNGCLGHGLEVMGNGVWERGRRSRRLPSAVRTFLFGDQDSISGAGGGGGEGSINSSSSSSSSAAAAAALTGNGRGKPATRAIVSIVRVAVKQVSCGCEHTLCVDQHGSVWSWGCGAYGALGHGDTTTLRAPKKITRLKSSMRIRMAVAGAKHSVAITQDDGYLYAWGHGDKGRLGNNSEIGTLVPIRVEKMISGLTANKRSSGGNDNVIMFVHVSAGEAHSAAVTVDGNVFTWGTGSHGRLGHDSVLDEPMPRIVASLAETKMVQVACGTFHTLFLSQPKGRSGGEIYVCGGASEGRLGLGNRSGKVAENQTYPRVIGGPISALPVVQISCNMMHNVASDIEGHVWTWGFGGHGRLGYVCVSFRDSLCWYLHLQLTQSLSNAFYLSLSVSLSPCLSLCPSFLSLSHTYLPLSTSLPSLPLSV